jgi:predicted nucleotidyltransferase
MGQLPKLRDIYGAATLPWLVDRTIFATIHGSRAYGTNISGSDVDVKGVCVPPKEYYFGHDMSYEQTVQSKPYDMVVYSLKKFMKLAADCNPNIIEVLFTDKEHWVHWTGAGLKLQEHRGLFLSKKAKHTFSGYAMAQLKRIKSHKAWLLNPPTHKPEREEFGLSVDHKVSASERGAYDSMEREGYKFSEDVMRLLGQERAYHSALTQWKQYEDWKGSRNEKRAALEAKFGYDTKHAGHLVRLMRMGEEILTTGEVKVKRPDAAELLEIRGGAWSYEKLIAWAESQDSKLTALYDSDKSPLPHKPDQKRLRQLCMEITGEMLK